MTKNTRHRSLSVTGQIGRSLLKRFMYSQLAVLTGIKIAFGKEQPLIRFTIEKEPPSVYWVFLIKEESINDLEKQLHLPNNLSLCAIRCLEEDNPHYLMTLNAYCVSGLANGLRAEWSVFVRDQSGIPRYMIVDARSSQRSVDPIGVITKASRVDHWKDGRSIITKIGEKSKAFRSKLKNPIAIQYVKVSSEWVSANDRIYWLNGIRDKIFYDGGIADAKVLKIDSNQAIIEDNSFWSKFLEPIPSRILVLDDAVELIISPWENVDQ